MADSPLFQWYCLRGEDSLLEIAGQHGLRYTNVTPPWRGAPG